MFGWLFNFQKSILQPYRLKYLRLVKIFLPQEKIASLKSNCRALRSTRLPFAWGSGPHCDGLQGGYFYKVRLLAFAAQLSHHVGQAVPFSGSPTIASQPSKNPLGMVDFQAQT